jgi:hypothetical protein
MPRYELLNNVTHGDLRVATYFAPEFGDAISMVPAFPTEFAELQREYPIFFRRDKQSHELHAVALLGFDRGENLFLQGQRWNAGYVPGAIAKGPFLIGFQHKQVDGELHREPVIHVDMEHARLNRSEGERLFLPHGGHSTYLQHIITVLRGINDGAAAAKPMFTALDALQLVQPMELDVRFDESHGANLGGLWSIDRERLAALDADAIFGLHRLGYLEGLYLVIASLHNLRRLIAEKQRRLLDQSQSPSKPVARNA